MSPKSLLEPSPPRPNGIRYLVRIGAACAALMAMFGLAAYVNGFVLAHYVIPAIATRVDAERESRIAADVALSDRIDQVEGHRPRHRVPETPKPAPTWRQPALYGRPGPEEP